MPLTRWLDRLRLHTPAALLLETYQPLSYLLGHVLAAFAPLLPWGDDELARWGERLVELGDHRPESGREEGS